MASPSLSAVCRLCNDELLVGRVVLQVRYQYKQIKKKLVTVLWIEVVILEQLDLTWLRTGLNLVKSELYN